jgi:hypothetical protein
MKITAHPASLAHALMHGNARAVMSQLYPNSTPSSEVAGTGRHSLRETAPEVLGGFPPADCGPATVGVLSEREHLRLQPPYERFVAELYELLVAERHDEALDLLRTERREMHGRS